MRTQAFYRDLFGWHLEGASSGYALVDTQAGEGAIGGGIGAAAGEDEGTRWATFYAHVHHVEAALGNAERLGGARVYGPMTVGDHMKTGALRDPAGSVIGVYEHEH
jgi:predicted enzyme related to lactoylglutathione lyase